MPKDPYDLPFGDKLNRFTCTVAEAALKAQAGARTCVNDYPEVQFWRGVLQADHTQSHPPTSVGIYVISTESDGFSGNRHGNPTLKESEGYYVKRVWHRNGRWFFELDDHNREDGEPALYAASAFTF